MWRAVHRSAPGSYVPADETIEAFTRICDGVYDDVPEQAFSGIGGIDDLEEVAQHAEGTGCVMAAEKTTMKVNIVAADHPVSHGEATSVTVRL